MNHWPFCFYQHVAASKLHIGQVVVVESRERAGKYNALASCSFSFWAEAIDFTEYSFIQNIWGKVNIFAWRDFAQPQLDDLVIADYGFLISTFDLKKNI